MQQQYLLTIAIPTYNRAECLELCLEQLAGQAQRIGRDVELLISDNASTDRTPEVVAHFTSQLPICSLRNHENIGADANFMQCYRRASGKYLLILADDDLLLDGALDRVISELEKRDYGVVHLRSYSFTRDFRAEGPVMCRDAAPPTIYIDHRRFVERVNVMLTFISGNIVNRQLVDSCLDIDSFLETNLVQMSWTLSALLRAEKNLYIEQPCIAAKAENTGGYRLCTVFGVNLWTILQRFEQSDKAGVSESVVAILLTDFLPGYILKLRTDSTSFVSEDYYSILAPVYRGKSLFWIATVPVIRLPLPVARIWYKLIKKVVKLIMCLRR